MHPNPRVETHLFSNSAKSLDIAGLHHKNSRYVGSAKLQEILVMRTTNKGARGKGVRGGPACCAPPPFCTIQNMPHPPSWSLDTVLLPVGSHIEATGVASVDGWVADPIYRWFLWCRPAISSDCALLLKRCVSTRGLGCTDRELLAPQICRDMNVFVRTGQLSVWPDPPPSPP